MQKMLRYCRQDKQEGMEYREYLRRQTRYTGGQNAQKLLTQVLGRQDTQEDWIYRRYLRRHETQKHRVKTVQHIVRQTGYTGGQGIQKKRRQTGYTVQVDRVYGSCLGKQDTSYYRIHMLQG